MSAKGEYQEMCQERVTRAMEKVVVGDFNNQKESWPDPLQTVCRLIPGALQYKFWLTISPIRLKLGEFPRLIRLFWMPSRGEKGSVQSSGVISGLLPRDDRLLPT